MLEIAREINEQLFIIIMEEITKIDKSVSIEIQINTLIRSIKKRVKVFIVEIQTRWRIRLDEIGTQLKFDGKQEIERIETSLSSEYEEETKLLIKYIDELKEKEPDEPKIEYECSQNFIEEIESPIEDLYRKMIYNEISISTVRKILWPILGNTNRDKIKAWTAVLEYHEKWVERTRSYKDEVHTQVLMTLFEKNKDLIDIFSTWEATVNEYITKWKKKSHSIISKYIEEKDGSIIITKIKKRTETFISDALEVDAQLKKHYFESYLDKLPNVESEVAKDFAQLSSMINLHYFFSLTKIVQIYKTTEVQTTIKDPIFEILEKVWNGISLWFMEEIPTVDDEEWTKTLIGSVRIIIESKVKILQEHKDLWDVLNDKFDLAGPDGSMTNVIDEGGKCDVFRLIRGASIE
jgi:hypothetical protein